MQEIIKIENIEGDLRVSSRLIAEHFEKRHDSVLRDIENLISNIGSPQNCGSLHKDGVAERSADLFKESKYQHSQNKQWYKEYLMTRDGFTLLVMGFTGKKALEWKLKYIEAFNKMEEEIRNNREYQFEELSTEMKALLMHDKKIQAVQKEVMEVKENLTEFKEDLPLFTVECEEISKAVKRVGTKVLGGHGSKAYNNKSLRAKVYSDIHSQLKREFDVNSYKAIKRRHLNEAIDIVENYSLTIALNEHISMLNNQVAFVQ
ncbi:antirepressor [[Clostridium] sordellii]|uniref:Rha family transcriptional regulator n=1 Tax=Paraclostridium sordellii TaxID=1505 RepID=UPI00054411A9|nr:Rha family transcriptional regulator [Paeniclostridium sordellii]CEK29391.1 antirepressor [[Clostridium] sordellii] [Paeniclostridium sordellii]